MTPQPYLTKNGIKIFNAILAHIQEKELDENIDSYELSMLANAFDLHERASTEMNKTDNGYTQVTKNGYSQIKAEFTAWQKTGDYIKNHSDKFGLNPAAREKIKAFAKKEDKPADPLSKF